MCFSTSSPSESTTFIRFSTIYLAPFIFNQLTGFPTLVKEKSFPKPQHDSAIALLWSNLTRSQSSTCLLCPLPSRKCISESSFSSSNGSLQLPQKFNACYGYTIFRKDEIVVYRWIVPYYVDCNDKHFPHPFIFPSSR